MSNLDWSERNAALTANGMVSYFTNLNTKNSDMDNKEKVNKILNGFGEVQPNGDVIYDNSELTEIEEQLVKLFTIPNVLVRFADYLAKTGTYVHDDIKDFYEQDF